ncbi:MAG: DUF6057 family protein [Limisphaerales bacterium]
MRQQAVNRKFGAETFFWPWPAFPIGVGVLLVGSFLYVWLRVEPLLEYHSYGPYFFRQRAFMDGFLGRPGGLASYAGVFLAQLNCLSWLGALVFVLFECGVVLAALVCLARISGRAPGFIALVPLFVLLLLRNRYGCPVAAISVGFLLALAAFAAYASLPWRRPWWATAVSGVISALLFFVAGLWSGLLSAVLCCLFVSVRMRNWPGGLVCLVLGLAAPAAVLGAGKLGIARLVNPWLEGVGWVLAAALYALVPVAGAVLALLPEPGTTRPAAPWPVSPKRAGQAIVVLAFLFGWAAVWLGFDRRQKLLAEIDYETGCGHYEAVLAAARQVKALSHPAKVRLHLALYHTGRLAEDLFSFHNMIDDPPLEGVGEDWRAQSQPLFELGLVNDAEHMALEALEMEGDRPDLLRLLARINLLKGRPEAAQVFLNVLSLIPFQGERADAAWPTIDPRMPATEGALLDRVRAGALTNEVPHDGLPVGPLLDVLLASNPTNRMAFEYVMAHYLMDLDLKRAVERLRLLNNFSYAGIPRAYEEALVLYQQVAGVQVKLKGRAVRPETAERFRQFREAARQLREGAEAEGTLAARFGDTYWYYYFAALGRKQADGGQASAP